MSTTDGRAGTTGGLARDGNLRDDTAGRAPRTLEDEAQASPIGLERRGRVLAPAGASGFAPRSDSAPCSEGGGGVPWASRSFSHTRNGARSFFVCSRGIPIRDDHHVPMGVISNLNAGLRGRILLRGMAWTRHSLTASPAGAGWACWSASAPLWPPRRSNHCGSFPWPPIWRCSLWQQAGAGREHSAA